MINLAFLPAVANEDDLADLLARISWYLHPFRTKISSIRIWIDGLNTAGKIQIPNRFDSNIERYAASIIPLVRFDQRTSQRDNDIQALADSTALFVWRTNDPTFSEPEIASAIQRFKSAGRCFEVDADRTRMEGSFYLWAGLKIFENERDLAEQNRSRFETFCSTIGHRKRAYVFGTGPSLSDFVAKHDFSDGVCFASNSMVKNEALLDRLKPVAIIAADPIFHAGCSRYAEVFRHQLVRVMRAHDMHFITSLRDYSAFHSCLPEDLRSKIIGVPFKSNAPFNPDLSKSFHVQPLANILTLLLLPVAGAVADEICIAGCDGRPIKQNDYFWTHDKEVQFNDEMENIKLVHPAFFSKADYDEYYTEHCKNVGLAVDQLEHAGKTVKVLTPSYIPALSARHKPPSSLASAD